MKFLEKKAAGRYNLTAALKGEKDEEIIRFDIVQCKVLATSLNDFPIFFLIIVYSFITTSYHS